MKIHNETKAKAKAKAMDAMEKNTALFTEKEVQGLHNLQRGVGEVCLLMAGHPLYKDMFLGDLRRAVVMPVLLNQYRIVRNAQDRTLGFISWARVDETVHKRLMNGVLKLQDKDWQSGNFAVVMDIVSPGTEAGARMLKEVKKELFAEETLWVVDSHAGAREPKLKQYALPAEGAA